MYNSKLFIAHTMIPVEQINNALRVMVILYN